MLLKRRDIITSIIILFSLLTITNSVNNVECVKKSANLSYGDVTYIASDEVVDFNKEIIWSFDCSNGIGITVLALTNDEFSSFNPLLPFSGLYILSNGNFYEDSGRFEIPDSDEWIVVFIHVDTANLFSSAIVEVNVRFSLIGTDTLALMWQILKIGGPILGGIVVLLFIVWGFSKLENANKRKKLKEDAEIKGITLLEAETERKQKEYFTNGEFLLFFVGSFIAIGMIIIGALFLGRIGAIGIIILIIGILGLAGAIVFVVLRVIKKIKIRKALDSGTMKVVVAEKTTIEPTIGEDLVTEKQTVQSETTSQLTEQKLIFCWNCGGKNPITQKFCGQCGKNLSMKDE
ncbi:MAG TPA: zinc ribbon domain-containing protein [candidate division Zixibacteria bacterium]|nr:zinc ribbon domain-containing protein [candidate division Zixibacteria bacterium]